MLESNLGLGRLLIGTLLSRELIRLLAMKWQLLWFSLFSGRASMCGIRCFRASLNSCLQSKSFAPLNTENEMVFGPQYSSRNTFGWYSHRSKNEVTRLKENSLMH